MSLISNYITDTLCIIFDFSVSYKLSNWSKTLSALMYYLSAMDNGGFNSFTMYESSNFFFVGVGWVDLSLLFTSIVIFLYNSSINESIESTLLGIFTEFTSFNTYISWFI